MKRKIAIVCGGDSSEFEVSLHSADGLESFFDKERYDVYRVVMRGMKWQVSLPQGDVDIDKEDFSFVQGSQRVKFDYAYITIHGTPGENGLIQSYFEMVHVPYSTCNVLVEALTFDKYTFNNYLRGQGVRVADSVRLFRDEPRPCTNEEIVERLGLPCFVKPTADGSSFGVSKVKTFEELEPALEKAYKQSNEVMVERYMHGVELAQGCYKTRKSSVVLPATEVVSENEFFDYDAKYNGQVDEITPARISEETAREVARMTSQMYDLLHANGIIRVDYIVTKDDAGRDVVNVLELNTTPGMTATSFIPQQVRAAGLNMTDVLTEIVENQF